MLERLLKKAQMYLIQRNASDLHGQGRITLSDKQIELHPRSPEKKIIQQYNSLLTSLGLFSFRPEHDSGLS